MRNCVVETFAREHAASGAVFVALGLVFTISLCKVYVGVYIFMHHVNCNSGGSDHVSNHTPLSDHCETAFTGQTLFSSVLTKNDTFEKLYTACILFYSLTIVST